MWSIDCPDRLSRLPAAEEEKSHGDEYGETDTAAENLPVPDGAGLGGREGPLGGAIEQLEPVRFERFEVALIVAG